MNIKDLKDFLLDIANKSNMEHKYACAIFNRNNLLSYGFNSYKINIYNNFNKKYETNKYSIHAEKAAIRKVKNKNILKDCKIYIIKIKGDTIEQGIPCPMCYNLLNKYNITKIETI